MDTNTGSSNIGSSNIQWISNPEVVTTYDPSGRYDILPNEGGFLLRENKGVGTPKVNWHAIDTFETVDLAKAAVSG